MHQNHPSLPVVPLCLFVSGLWHVCCFVSPDSFLTFVSLPPFALLGLTSFPASRATVHSTTRFFLYRARSRAHLANMHLNMVALAFARARFACVRLAGWLAGLPGPAVSACAALRGVRAARARSWRA